MLRNFIFTSLLLVVGFTLSAQDQIDTKSMDAYFTQMVKDWEVPSVAIGVVKEGKLVFTGNYGVKETGKLEGPDEHTLYAIASNSKAFTSAMIGLLVQEGKLDWNDRVQKYLPYFELYDPWVSSHVTIKDLLCHRVGLGTFSGDNIWYKSTNSAKDFIKNYKYVPQAYDFRAGYGYSNLMYIAAGEIIETITGKSWEENIRERFLEPLGMNRTIVDLDDLDVKGNYAIPHVYRDNANQSVPYTDWENVAATGGLISSVSDIAKWMIFNLNHGIHGQDTILTKATRNMLWTPHNNFTVDHTSDNFYGMNFRGYALGWGVSDFHGHMRIAHTGGYDGMLTSVSLIPDKKIGVVVLTNGTKSPFMAATYYALDKFLGINTGKDWSADFLKNVNNWRANDTRISDRKKSKILNSKPGVLAKDFIGDYYSKVYGDISIAQDGDQIKLNFSHSPLLSATLTHWHYDVWQIHWDHPQAWFSFGTIQINTDNNRKVIGFDFDVPNDDFFFEELKPMRK